MKKLYIVSLLTICSLYTESAWSACANDDFGHTFFSVHPEYQSSLPIKETFMRNRAKARCDQGGNAAIQFVPFGGQSNKGDNLMKYFGPDSKTELVVDSNPTTGGQTGIDRDINPIHFGIDYTLNGQADGAPGRYKSTITFAPQRTVGGIGFTYRQYFGRAPNACDNRWYMEISVPLIQVRNKIHLEETCDCADQRGFPTPGSAANMIDAFTGEQGFLGGNIPMQFGLINDASKIGMSKLGAEAEVKLGYDFYNTQEILVELYLGLNAPLNRVPNGVQMFEAVPGFNRHFGLIVGSGLGFLLTSNPNNMTLLAIDSNFRYFFKNSQTRSFDLKGRKWSRYMIVREPGGTITPGINLFTQRMNVRPRASFDINVALIFETRTGMDIEMGYNFFTRQAEKVCLKNPFPQGYQTVGFNPITLRPDTNLITIDSNIASNACPLPAPGQPGFIPGSTISEQNLNLLSAAHPAMQSNQVYLAVGSLWNTFEQPLVAGLGVSYEFSGKNTALNRWLLWGTVGISL